MPTRSLLRDRPAEPERACLISVTKPDRLKTLRYGSLSARFSKAANVLFSNGSDVTASGGARVYSKSRSSQRRPRSDGDCRTVERPCAGRKARAEEKKEMTAPVKVLVGGG